MKLRPELKITYLYLASGISWILLSDKMLLPFIGQPYYPLLQSMKGVFYVGITAVFLYVLLQRFYRELNHRIAQLEHNESRLKTSEKIYRYLFNGTPLPKMLFDKETFRIIDVNEAAVAHYGYSREAFLSMTVKDLGFKKESRALIQSLCNNEKDGKKSLQGIFRHKKQNGEVILVDIHSVAIKYGGKKAGIMIANDVTEGISYIKAIKRQNRRLQDIAWMQSHVVRAPLASLMGCVYLIKNCHPDQEEYNQILEGITRSSADLDEIIRNITRKAEMAENLETKMEQKLKANQLIDVSE